MTGGEGPTQNPAFLPDPRPPHSEIFRIFREKFL
jgi:hypothetical protein